MANLPSFVSAPKSATAPAVSTQGPAPAPSYGDFAAMATAQISDKTPPKPGLGLYACTCDKVVRKSTALIFEYTIDEVRAPTSESSPPGFKSSHYRDTKDPKYFGYTAQVALAIAGVDTSDKAIVQASQQYLPAMLAAATTGQTCFGPNGEPIGPDALLGKRFLLQVSPGKATGKVNAKTGLPYTQEDVFPIGE